MDLTENQRNILIFVIVALLLIFLLKPFNMSEMFDASTTTFVPVGEDRYGLRGDLLDGEPIETNYLAEDHMVNLGHNMSQGRLMGGC